LGLVALDLEAMIFGALGAQLVRFGDVSTSVANSPAFSYPVLTLLLAPAWVATMALSGAYERRYLGAGSEEYRRVFDAAVRFLALVAIGAFVLDIPVARGFVAVTIPLACVLDLTLRYALRRWLHNRRKRGSLNERLVLIGSPAACVDLIRHLLRSPFTGFSVIGAYVPVPVAGLDVDGEHVPVLGSPDDVREAIARSEVDAIAVADTTTLAANALRRLAWQLEGTGVDLMLAPGLVDVAGPRVSVRPVAGLPLLHLEEPEFRGFRRIGKAVFDRTFAAAALLFLLPLLVLLGLAVRLSSPGPALFRQVRSGLHGRPFVLFKLRTMTVDAESRLAELLPLNEHDGLLFKIRDDPRMTRVGRFLRRWSLDELPQLWNVFVGHMSIVGPRPPLPSEVCGYNDDVRRRLLVKPGLTGLWQVSGRTELSWTEAVRLDL